MSKMKESYLSYISLMDVMTKGEYWSYAILLKTNLI